MKFERSTSAMIEAALVAVIAAVIALTIGYIPVIGYLTLFMPAIFAVVWIRRGRHYGALSVVVAGIVTFILGFPTESFVILSYGGVVAGFLSEGIRSKLKASQVIVLGALGAIFSMIILFSFTEFITGIGLTEIFSQAIDESKEILKSYPLDTASMTDIDAQMDLLMTQMTNTLPFIIIMSGVITSSINHWAIRKGLKRIRYTLPEPGLFRDFELPRNVFVGSMIMMLMAWLTGQMGFVNSDMLFLNVLLVVILVFSIQGAAVAIYFMYHYKFPRPAVVAFTVGGILFFSMLQFPLFMLGMMETIINLRGRMRSNT